MPKLDNYFNEMDDPRGGNAPRHKFCDLMTISLLCALCGGDTAVDMELFGQSKEDFLREFLELPHGIPCHDAYSRLFRVMKPTSFQAFFDKFRADFVSSGAEQLAIAIDGKEMRRSFDKAAEKSNMNIVTAFAHGARLTLGITQSAKGGGEILALRELIKMLDIRGITITADALHCQRETCELIVQEGGEYCLQLKGNQGDMLADVKAFVEDQDTDYIDEYNTIDADHGRIEERSYRVYDVPEYLIDTHKWPHLQSFVHVVSKRAVGDKTSHSERLYLLSKCNTAQAAATLIRGHWQIENSLHWSLDVVLNDDQHRARKDHAPANFAALRRIALSIIKANPAKGSNRGKFKKAGWSHDFLRTLIQGF
jgi:predicted transposase YbfD/YdcC|tara:strand:- start:16 stop:1116 length:1101 start_codon:yes stop_codon:yes gene_type:complete